MKRYVEQMDRAEVSDALHEKLIGLSAPKKAAAWKRYGSMAAALALVIGLGAAGLSGRARDAVEIERDELNIDAIGSDDLGAEPDGGAGAHTETDGGYEVADGEMVGYYFLPAIIYNDERAGVAADYSLAAPGAVNRDADLTDIQAMLGKTDMAAHLLWGDDLAWSGTVWYDGDGAATAAALYAEGAEVSFGVEIMAGSAVPDCIVYPDDSYEHTEFFGTEITGLRNTGYIVREDGTELRESRQVSCFASGIGYKMTICGVDGETVEAMCARFMRYAVAEGFDLAALSEGSRGADGTAPGGQEAPDAVEDAGQDSAEQTQEACTWPYDSNRDGPVPNSTPEE